MDPELRFLSSREYGESLYTTLEREEAFLVPRVAALRALEDKTPFYFASHSVYRMYFRYGRMEDALAVLREMASISVAPGDDCSSFIADDLWKYHAPPEVTRAWVTRGIDALALETRRWDRRNYLYCLRSVELALEAQSDPLGSRIAETLERLLELRPGIRRYSPALKDALLLLKDQPGVIARALPLIEGMTFRLRRGGYAADSDADTARHLADLKALRKTALTYRRSD
jgi:pentatricopeptide repeat protein